MKANSELSSGYVSRRIDRHWSSFNAMEHQEYNSLIFLNMQWKLVIGLDCVFFLLNIKAQSISSFNIFLLFAPCARMAFKILCTVKHINSANHIYSLATKRCFRLIASLLPLTRSLSFVVACHVYVLFPYIICNVQYALNCTCWKSWTFVSMIFDVFSVVL